MKAVAVRYKAKPERAEENAALIDKVFQELKAKGLRDVRYLALRLADDSFIHFSIAENAEGVSPIPKLDAFRTFRAGVEERALEPPQQSDVRIVGHYRMFD
jgi:hypothetical protein